MLCEARFGFLERGAGLRWRWRRGCICMVATGLRWRRGCVCMVGGGDGRVARQRLVWQGLIRKPSWRRRETEANNALLNLVDSLVFLCPIQTAPEKPLVKGQVSTGNVDDQPVLWVQRVLHHKCGGLSQTGVDAANQAAFFTQRRPDFVRGFDRLIYVGCLSAISSG